MIFQQDGDKRRYAFLDADCIGRPCFSPGEYQHRGATMSGSRNTGAYSACCMRRAYHGCPLPKTAFDAELARQRRTERWRKA